VRNRDGYVASLGMAPSSATGGRPAEAKTNDGAGAVEG